MIHLENLATTVIAELAFGIVYAVFLQSTKVGQYLANYIVWFSVVIGVAGTGIIPGLTGLFDWPLVGWMALCFVGSGAAIIVWSIGRAAHEWGEIWGRNGRGEP